MVCDERSRLLSSPDGRQNLRTPKGDAARLRGGQQEASARLPDRGAGRSRLRHQRMRQAPTNCRPMLDTELPDLDRARHRVDGIEAGKFLEILVREAVRRQGSRRRRPRVDHRQGRAAGRRGIRPCDAAAADHAIRRRDACASASRCCCRRSRRRARPCMCARRCTPAGSNSGISRRSTPVRWFAAAPRRWCGCGIRPGAWCRRPISSRRTTIRICRDLSEFVIERAVQDWHYLLEQQSAVDHLDQPARRPISGSRQAVRDLCRRMPTHPAFGGLPIEINSAEAIHDLDLLIEIAREMRFHNIAALDRQSRRQLAGADGAGRIPFIEAEGRPAIRHRLRQ